MIKNKKATINPDNDDDKWFQYVIKIALNPDKIRKNPQRTSKAKKYMNQYDWSGINFPLHVGDWKRFELSNKSVALNILYVPEGKKNYKTYV